MAQDIVNKLQTLSYTSKDFNSIYPELLNTVKQLTYKWDPSISNESDPGVLLLKLNAIIADKCNYNIDTSVLECFPLSVTQQRNARQLFEQLGYYMHWYKSAVATVALKWTGTLTTASNENLYTIPAFTMVADADTNIVYTLIGPSDVTSEDDFIVQDTQLSTTGTTLSLKAIEGKVNDFSANGVTLITIDMLDSNNRLYFSTSDIAENGIFIHNYNLENYDEWQRKDNLLVEAVNENNKFYKFGVAQDTATCYIEFPTNAAEIIRDGIYIKYIRSSGSVGNISYKILEKFYSNFSPAEDETITFSTENVKLYNISSGVGGSDCETINEAYKGYKTTVGTFKTLVTVRDYIDAFINNKLASNGFVCDRNDDIQSTYDIMSSVGGVDQHITHIDSETVTTTSGTSINIPDLTAFSLKCYLLQYANLNTVYSDKLVTDFNTTFTPYTNSELDSVESYIEDMKLISHDYVDIQPTTAEKMHFCYIKNVYPLSMKITPQCTLSAEDKTTLRQNILSALYSAVNATQIDFGDEVSLDLLLQTIQNADNRIKNVSLDSVTYTPYAVYWDGSSYQSVQLTPVKKVWQAWDDATVVSNITINEVVFTTKNNYNCRQTFSFTKEDNSGSTVYKLNNNSITISEYGIEDNTGLNTFSYIIKCEKAAQAIDELYTKSVLNGTTQFFVKDEEYDYKINQVFTSEISGNSKITTNVDVSLNQDSPTYFLRENEYLQFFAPNYKNATEYSNYVRFEYKIGTSLTAKTNYLLQANEYVAFYWKDSVDTAALYNYYIYGPGNYICPSFELTSNSNTTIADSLISLYGTPEGAGTIISPNYYSSEIKNIMTYNISQQIGNLTTTANYLDGVKTITIKQQNSITLSSGEYCYWLLNDKSDNDTYTLFAENVTTYTLAENEYFIYSNANLEELVILGSGTKITRSGNTSEWTVAALDYEAIYENGSSALDGYWFNLPQGATLIATEQQILTLTPGMTLTAQLKEHGGTINYEKLSGESSTSTITVDSQKYISYVQPTAASSKQFDWDSTAEAWKVGTDEVDLNDYGITYSDTGSGGTKTGFKVNYSLNWYLKINNSGFTLKADNTSSGTDIPLSNLTLYYSQGTTKTEINALIMGDATDQTTWDILSKLILNISNTASQHLLTNQSVKFDETTITGSDYDTTTGEYAVTLMSNTDVLVSGKDQNIPKIYNVEDDSYSYAKFYQYEDIRAGQKDVSNTAEICNRVVIGTDTISYRFLTSDFGEIYVRNKLKYGDYLIPVTIPELPSDITSVQILQGTDVLKPIYDSSITTLTEAGTYFLYWNKPTVTDEMDTSTKLIVRLNTSSASPASISKEITVVVGNAYKFNYPDNLNNFVYTETNDYSTQVTGQSITVAEQKAELYANKIKKMLIDFDPEHYFNYTYEVPEDTQIANPIKATEFFNSNHIFNEFTIAQYNAISSSYASEKIRILG